MVKLCTKCLTEKPLEAFKPISKKMNKNRLRSWCQECCYTFRRKYYSSNPEQQAKLRQANRQKKVVLSELLLELKNNPCMDCGGKWPPYVMDFDHRDPSAKVKTVAAMRRDGNALQTMVDEIAKCDLVCSNCHRIRTFKKKEGPDTYSILLPKINRSGL